MIFALKLNRCTIPTRTYINTYHVDAVRPFTVRDVQKCAARYNGMEHEKTFRENWPILLCMRDSISSVTTSL